jgi:hypothetical protein
LNCFAYFSLFLLCIKRCPNIRSTFNHRIAFIQ